MKHVTLYKGNISIFSFNCSVLIASLLVVLSSSLCVELCSSVRAIIKKTFACFAVLPIKCPTLWLDPSVSRKDNEAVNQLNTRKVLRQGRTQPAGSLFLEQEYVQ